MTNTMKLISKTAVAIGLIGSLAVGAATPSLAQASTMRLHDDPIIGLGSNDLSVKTAGAQNVRRDADAQAFAHVPSVTTNGDYHPPGTRLNDDPIISGRVY